MNTCGIVLWKATTVVLCALIVAAGGTMVAGVARGATLFTGSYDAVLKVPGQPDQVSIWNASSYCALRGCVAHVASPADGSDWLFTETQWTRLAVPQIGTCNGVTVPARSASQILVPQADGSLSGAVSSTVDCNGATVDLSQPLILTPWAS
jgi:hypothetical protein